MKRLPAIAFVLLAALAGCNQKNPNDPSPTPTPTPTSTPQPQPVLHSVTGRVTTGGTTAVGGATLRILDGPNAGQIATSSASGNYTLANLQRAGFTVQASAPFFATTAEGVSFPEGSTTATINFNLTPIPVFTRSGVGNDVFDMPLNISRVRIEGVYTANSSNFVVRIGGRLIVNELVGTFWGQTHYNGVHLIGTGGVTEVTLSSGVQWTFTEVRQ